MAVAVPEPINRFDIDAIKRLPAGASLLVDDVTWDEYEELLVDLAESSSLRLFYDHGRFLIMSPATRHEVPKIVIHNLVEAIGFELDVLLTSRGSTTIRSQLRSRGAEPDDCFYVRNAERVIGLLDFDLDRDPPPDLVIESDFTSDSLDKYPIYAGFGIPEIWRVTGSRVNFLLLKDGVFVPSEKSRAFPFLDAVNFSAYVAIGTSQGEQAAVRAFRKWLNDNRNSFSI